MIDLTKFPAVFPLGRVVATPGVLQLNIDLHRYLNRHVSGDWGELDPEDWAHNNAAINQQSRILSAYTTPKGRIWIITEADRSSTCILLPSEY